MSRDDALVGRLVELWEASVRATHDFLREEDIRGIRTYVPDALRSIADLRDRARCGGSSGRLHGV